MPRFEGFRFCLCNEADVLGVSESRRSVDGIAGSSGRNELLSSTIIAPTRDSSDVKVTFHDTSEEVKSIQDESTASLAHSLESLMLTQTDGTYHHLRMAASQDGTGSVAPAGKYQHQDGGVAKQLQRKSTIDDLHNGVRAARVDLRKVHAKLKLDLNEMLKLRDTINPLECAADAYLPDITTEKIFTRKFWNLVNNAQNEISIHTENLISITRDYARILKKSESGQSCSNTAMQVESESQRLASDSDRILIMLRKAMDQAVIEYKLKVMLLDRTSCATSNISELAMTLLNLKRLKSSAVMGFEEDLSKKVESASCHTVRNLFSRLFPLKRTLKLEKKLKLRFAELHVAELENSNHLSDTKLNIWQVDETRCDNGSKFAIDDVLKTGIPEIDESARYKNQTQKITPCDAQNCLGVMQEAIEKSSHKEVMETLKEANSRKIPESHSRISKPQSIEQTITEAEKKRKTCLGEQDEDMKRKSSDDKHRSLADIEGDLIPSVEASMAEETKSLVDQRDNQGLIKDAADMARVHLVTSLESDNPSHISETILRARSAGLSNCVEIMGAKTKLSQLRQEKGRYLIEMKKIENYLEKLASRAGDNATTIDLMITLERAMVVADSLEVPPETKQRARTALRMLESRKELVKNVKDELQRAVMECRQESITCAIAKAESIPYFLTFDPLDGQIAAILEYAKNKTLLQNNRTSVALESNSSIRRVKSNLKRAMRGSCSEKLESAISLYRKTQNLEHTRRKRRGETANELTLNESSANLLRRAEHKNRCLKRDEKLAEREWTAVLETLRGNLKTTMKENDRAELWKAVYQFKRELGSTMSKDDEALLLQARNQLRKVTVLQFKRNLSCALQERDPTRIRHSLIELDSPPLAMFSKSIDEKFKDDIAKAKKLLAHFKEIERIKKSVSEMSRSQLAEIHRYPNPPPCVRSVMTATYLLLGENEKEIKDWAAVMRLLVKMGRDGLTRRIAVCNPGRIPIAKARRAFEILSEFSEHQVKDINKRAAIFFSWAHCIVEDVFDRHEQDPSDTSLPEPNRLLKETKRPNSDPMRSEFWNRLSRPRSCYATKSHTIVNEKIRPTSAMK